MSRPLTVRPPTTSQLRRIHRCLEAPLRPTQRRRAEALLLLAACSGLVFYQKFECDTLYFGTAKPDHSVITAAEWQKFLDDEVTPRFEGFTHWEGHG